MDLPHSSEYLLDLSHISYNNETNYQKSLLGSSNILLPLLGGTGNIMVIYGINPLLEPVGEISFPQLISSYGEKLSKLKSHGITSVLLTEVDSLAECRAASLMAREIGMDLSVSFRVGDEGFTVDGSYYLSALLTLQGIGCSRFILHCCTAKSPQEERELVEEMLQELLKYSTIPIGVVVNSHGLSGTQLNSYCNSLITTGADFIVNVDKLPPQTIVDMAAAINTSSPNPVKKLSLSDEEAICAGYDSLHFLNEHSTISQDIYCGYDMSQAIMEAEDQGCDILRIILDSIDDSYLFSINSRMATVAVAFVAHDEATLESALTFYNGIAIIDPICDLPRETLEKYAKIYNSVIF